jgi:hypothetical protein
MNQRFLTKSRFKIAVECPRKLYYTGKEIYRNAKREDTFLQALADGGFQVGELAKCLYPDGIEVKARSNTQAVAETAELMRHENVTLFEPAIAHGNFLVRVDVLVKSGKSIKLIEVKAKSIDSTNLKLESRTGIKPAYRPYIEDITFQVHVVSSAYPDHQVTGHLMMPDKAKVATIDRMNQLFKIKKVGEQTAVEVDERAKTITADEALLHEFPVGDYINLVHADGLSFPGGSGSMAEMAQLWSDAYAEDRPLQPVIGTHCASCEFKTEPGSALRSGFHECWQEAKGWTSDDLSKPTVLELWNFRGKRKLIDRNKWFLADVDHDDLGVDAAELGLSNSQRQWMQIQWATNAVSLPVEHKSAGFFLDHDYMAHEMGSWRYPLHFIDFETSTTALPFHAGMRPYESVAFQFSHHVLERDGSLRHAGEKLIVEPGEFPNYEFARALRDEMSRDHGSVFMWATHENTILTHIIEQLKKRHDAPGDKAELLAFLQTLIKGGSRAMIDLRTVAQKGYYHPATKGSNSIKKVMPAILESSAFLRERYSKPIYGSEGGIPSRNFQDMVWWTQNERGQIVDPYKKLKSIDPMDPVTDVMDIHDLDIVGGGEAAMAYGRLQFETLNEAMRNALKAKLLRYCELDTLAMAMVVEAWKAECGI